MPDPAAVTAAVNGYGWIAQVIVAIATLAGVVFTGLNSLKSSRKVDTVVKEQQEVKKSLAETHGVIETRREEDADIAKQLTTQLDGKLAELIKKVEEQAMARGRAEGVVEGKNQAEALLKQILDRTLPPRPPTS